MLTRYLLATLAILALMVTAACGSGGQYLWDVHYGGAQTAMQTLRPNGVLDPVKPALLLPEVLDSSKWLGGLDNVWMDKDNQYVFGFEAGLQLAGLLNL